jgi:hypothetical protein
MQTHKMRRAAWTLASGLVIAGVAAGAAPAAPTAPASAPPIAAEHMPMADYLGLLARIAPAAEEGARHYLLAFQQRCGRPLATADLRRAMSDGDGDPVLMAMIRASHLRDAAALTRLGPSVACDRGAAR